MALIERFVSSLATGAGDGSSGSPWTLAQAVASAIAGDRVNVKADGTYALINSAVAANAGGASPVIFRGYKTTIGDGLQGRTNDNGPLLTTNMPVISCATNGRLTLAANTIFDSIVLSRAGTSSQALLTGAVRTTIVNSVINDSSSGASANTIQNATLVLNCDVSGASTTSAAISAPSNSRVIGCRITSPSAAILIGNGQLGVVVEGNQIYSSGVGIRIVGTIASTGLNTLILNNTPYNLTGSFLELPNNSVAAVQVFPILINNHPTDSAQFFNSLYAPTANVPAILFNNRTRDNTNPDAGYGDWPVFGAITTDAGNYTTDYIDAPNGDFRLVPGAAGRGAGFPAFRDVGATQHQDAGATAASSAPRGVAGVIFD